MTKISADVLDEELPSIAYEIAAMSDEDKPVNVVKCDGCGRDITSTGNSIGYRLALTCERVPSHAGPVTDMHFEPDIERPHHFCSLLCLDRWLDSFKSVG